MSVNEMFQNYAISPSLQCHCPNFCSQVIYAALEDVQMSVKRCAIEVLGKLDLPPDSQAVGCLGITGSGFRSSRNWITKCPKIDESGMIRITSLGFIYFKHESYCWGG